MTEYIAKVLVLIALAGNAGIYGYKVSENSEPDRGDRWLHLFAIVVMSVVVLSW